MFLVKDERHGATWLVFTHQDPKKDGCRLDIEEGASLVFEADFDHWPDGERRPEAPVGRDPANAKNYRVFRYRSDLDSNGYIHVPGMALVFVSWSDYLKLQRMPPDPNQQDEEDWYNYLDRVDDEARRLRQRTPWPEQPRDASRDAVAEWLAKQHFITDTTIREIWYLPQGAPPNEIRFLEVSERLLGNEDKVEPIDFGVEELGIRFRVAIGDVSTDHLEKIQRDSSLLPSGWDLDGKMVWRRRDR